MTGDRAARLREIADAVVHRLDEFQRLSVPVSGARYKYKILSTQARAREIMDLALKD